MKFKIIDDLTSDVFFEAYGESLKELFENAAYCMSSIICNVKEVKPISKIEVDITADNESDLLFSWLQKIIALIDTEELFFSKFDIQDISGAHLHAFIYGETITQELGETVVKAVTNYKFNLEKKNRKYKATISVDI